VTDNILLVEAGVNVKIVLQKYILTRITDLLLFVLWGYIKLLCPVIQFLATDRPFIEKSCDVCVSDSRVALYQFYVFYSFSFSINQQIHILITGKFSISSTYIRDQNIVK
jgi:hypothetical protein